MSRTKMKKEVTTLLEPNLIFTNLQIQNYYEEKLAP